MTQALRIAIIGGTLWGNRGAQAMLETTIGEMRQHLPQAEFGVFSYYPEKDRALLSDPTIRIFDARPLTMAAKLFPLALLYRILSFVGIRLPLPESLAFLRDCQVLCDIGGITFNDERLKYLPFNVLSILPAMLLGTPVAKLSQATGPFENPINRMVSKFLLSRCCLVVARGAITASHLKKLGINPAHTMVAADIAMLYKPDYALTTENVQQVEALLNKLTTRRQVIAVSPSVLVYKKRYEEYLHLLLDLIESAAADGREFVIFPNASRASSSKTHNNDLIALRALRRLAQQRLPQTLLSSIHWVDYDINYGSIQRIICACDLLITSRFHAMIAGLTCTTPTLVIGWSHKYQECLAGFEMESTAFDYSADTQQILQAVPAMLSHLAEFRAQLTERLPENQRSSASQFDRLKEIITWKN
ncbi:MAG TPA: polysaccharide pyruvyl transferase family protein [Chloroflexi bacterium]|nr:polysaccharide pyruvyl transferase family protein [Chloroflexota bacterium]